MEITSVKKEGSKWYYFMFVLLTKTESEFFSRRKTKDESDFTLPSKPNPFSSQESIRRFIISKGEINRHPTTTPIKGGQVKPPMTYLSRDNH
jgi:hypothetical protein